MKFSYKARNKSGALESGTIEASSQEAAAALLQKYNIFVTWLEEIKETTSWWKRINFERKVSKKELAIFFRQLSVMLESNVPVVQSLASLALENKKSNFKKKVAKVAQLVQEGVPLSEALSLYPETFSRFYISLIKSGETSGKIAAALSEAARHLEREYALASRVRQAMIYPVFLAGVLLVVVVIIITQIIPKIESLIQDTGNAPSAFTKTMLGFYDFLNHYWWAIFVVLFFITSAIVTYLHTKEGRKEYDQISLMSPLFGNVLKKLFLTRFCSNLSVLLLSGVSIHQALEVAGNTVDNVAYKKFVDEIRKKVSEGESLSNAMQEYEDYFPSFVIQIVRVGETTGKLDKTLMQVVDFYNKEIQRSINLFSKILEPFMIVVMGLVVAVLAASVLSSIYGSLGNL